MTKIYQKTGRAGYFANIKGVGKDGKPKTTRLGDTMEEAQIALGKLLEAPAAPAALAPGDVLTLGILLDRWLNYHKQTNAAPATLTNYTRYATAWKSLHDTKPAADITPDDLSEAIREKYTTYKVGEKVKQFSDSCRAQMEKVALGAFKWAVKRKLLTTNPLEGYDRQAAYGKRKSWISQEQYDKLIAGCDDSNLHDLLETFWKSGARPFELFQVEARHYDATGRRLILERANGDKVKARKKERDAVRIITLGSANEIVARLVAENPTGKLFTNRGKPWNNGTVGRAIHKLAEYTGVKANVGKNMNVASVTQYVFRHSYCTRYAKAGLPACELRKLTGHANTRMLESLYDKSENDADYMEGLARKAG